MSRPSPSPWLLAAVAALVGCDQANYIEGVVRWESRDARYDVEYVTPPWELEQDDGTELRLRIAAELFGVALQGSPPTHMFTLGPVDPLRSVMDYLPQGLPEVDTDAAELDTGGASSGDTTDDTGGDDTGAWTEIDLANPGQVALFELDQLVTGQRADLIGELARADAPDAPWTYEVAIAPGLFVRGYYYADGERTIRALFASMFTLTDGDVSRMASTIRVGGEAR